jgi:hypothetical protein
MVVPGLFLLAPTRAEPRATDKGERARGSVQCGAAPQVPLSPTPDRM